MLPSQHQHQCGANKQQINNTHPGFSGSECCRDKAGQRIWCWGASVQPGTVYQEQRKDRGGVKEGATLRTAGKAFQADGVGRNVQGTEGGLLGMNWMNERRSPGQRARGGRALGGRGVSRRSVICFHLLSTSSPFSCFTIIGGDKVGPAYESQRVLTRKGRESIQVRSLCGGWVLELDRLQPGLEFLGNVFAPRNAVRCVSLYF